MRTQGEIMIRDNGMLTYVVRILLGPAGEIVGVTVGLVHDHVVLGRRAILSIGMRL